MNKTLVIVRHAHRDKTHGDDKDNGLSEKGRKQARKVFDRYFDYFPEEEHPRLLSSPKKRCVETINPIALKLGFTTEISPLLTEQGDLVKRESDAAFKKRLQQFCQEWLRSPHQLTVICSHGDVIPRLFEILLNTPIDLKKGAWAEVEHHETVQLTWLLQTL